MICPGCGTHQSGDKCSLCGKVFKAKKEPVKKIQDKSNKLASEEREYKKLRVIFLQENAKCAVYPWLSATQVHHKRGRGKNLLEVSTWLPVSALAHDEIEKNPDWAYEKGYSELRLKNYDQTKETTAEESQSNIHH